MRYSGWLAAAGVLIACGSAAAQTLKITDAVVSQFEDGPALNGARAVPGEIVFIRFALAGYKTLGEGKISLVGHAKISDSRGVLIAPVDELAIATSLREEDKDFHPRFHFQFQLPSIAPPGNWRVHLDAIDKQTDQTAQADAEFSVAGHDVAPASEVTVRDLSFFRGPDDESPLKIAAYRPGDSVWVRFYVTGYKYGEQNAVDVSYDVAVSTADGKRLFGQEEAAVERSQAFYPQPWVPGTFSLTLQPTMKAGTYTVTITAHDGAGKKDAAAEAQFRVE